MRKQSYLVWDLKLTLATKIIKTNCQLSYFLNKILRKKCFLVKHVDPFLVKHVDPFLVKHVDPFLVKHVDPFLVKHVNPFLVKHVDPFLTLAVFVFRSCSSFIVPRIVVLFLPLHFLKRIQNSFHVLKN